MKVSEFDYHLPPGQIAQLPASRRDGSRLIVVSPANGRPEHRHFAEIVDLLRAGDLLVLNDTRVIKARLHGTKETGGAIELLLDRPLDPGSLEDGRWMQSFSCLVKSSRPLRPGVAVTLPGGGLARGLESPLAGEQPAVQLDLPQQLDAYLERHGEVPLPAYIKRAGPEDPRQPIDRERYQTVYARDPGAVAAPTAGLHFTRAILDRIRQGGVEIVSLTLHVGPGTFLPVRVEDVDQHRMHSERFRISTEAARALNQARAQSRRIVAVGTTVVRALESAIAGGEIAAGPGETELFIRPGFEFKVVGALITNFHLPRSTLLMLVCAFAGRQKMLSAYREAVEQGYRFYSYGDAMFISGRGES